MTTATQQFTAWETGHVIDEDGTVHLIEGPDLVCGDDAAFVESTTEPLTCVDCASA